MRREPRVYERPDSQMEHWKRELDNSICDSIDRLSPGRGSLLAVDCMMHRWEMKKLYDTFTRCMFSESDPPTYEEFALNGMPRVLFDLVPPQWAIAALARSMYEDDLCIGFPSPFGRFVPIPPSVMEIVNERLENVYRTLCERDTHE